jgi:hypothetical protein
MVQEQRLILNCPTGKASQGCIKKGLKLVLGQMRSLNTLASPIQSCLKEAFVPLYKMRHTRLPFIGGRNPLR